MKLRVPASITRDRMVAANGTCPLGTRYVGRAKNVRRRAATGYCAAAGSWSPRPPVFECKSALLFTFIPEIDRMTKGARRWPLVTFGAHTAVVLLVIIVDALSQTFTLRNMHEFVIDRHAFELWWWVQNEFPRELGAVLYPFARWWGLEVVSKISWLVWYIVVGALPYVLAAAVAARLRCWRRAKVGT
jgi:hypothetical protein